MRISTQLAFIAIPALLVAAACTSEPETKPCPTNPGCANELKIKVQGGDTNISGTVTTGDKTFTIKCNGATSDADNVVCSTGSITLKDPARAEKVNIKLTAGNGDAYGADVPVTFTDTYPNGENCPGACYTAEASVTLVAQPNAVKPEAAPAAPAGGGAIKVAPQ